MADSFVNVLMPCGGQLRVATTGNIPLREQVAHQVGRHLGLPQKQIFIGSPGGSGGNLFFALINLGCGACEREYKEYCSSRHILSIDGVYVKVGGRLGVITSDTHIYTGNYRVKFTDDGELSDFLKLSDFSFLKQSEVHSEFLGSVLGTWRQRGGDFVHITRSGTSGDTINIEKPRRRLTRVPTMKFLSPHSRHVYVGDNRGTVSQCGTVIKWSDDTVWSKSGG